MFLRKTSIKHSFFTFFCVFLLNQQILASENSLEGPVAHISSSPTPPTCQDCKTAKRILVPTTRILLLHTGMYIGLVAIWPDSFSPKTASAEQFKKSWTNPPFANMERVFFQLDNDPWWINGPLHALFGSESYIAARAWGHNPLFSFLFATAASFTWEYLIEGWFQQPSTIDLTWTPFSGAVLGELRFQLFKLSKNRVNNRGMRVFLMTLLDPIGQVERKLLKCSL